MREMATFWRDPELGSLRRFLRLLIAQATVTSGCSDRTHPAYRFERLVGEPARSEAEPAQKSSRRLTLVRISWG
jgi:hypothetical protein